MRGGGQNPCSFLLREPPPAPLPHPLSPTTFPPSCGGLARIFLRGDAEAVPAVADFVHETTHGSISCYSLLMRAIVFLFVSPSGSPTPESRSQVSLSGPVPSFNLHPPRARGCQRKVPQPRTDSTLTYTPAQGPLPGPGHSPTARHLGCSGLQQTLSLLKLAGSRMFGDQASAPLCPYITTCPNAPSRLKPSPW